MNGFPWLTVAGAIPLAGAIAISLVPSLPADSAPGDIEARTRLVKVLALAFSVVTLAWVIVMATRFNTSGPTFQLTEQYSWIPQFGVHYAVGVDGIALVLIGMTVVLMPVVLLASWQDADNAKRSVKTYFALMLVLETMMIAVFAATDVFLFYVFFEAMLIPMYFMIGSFGVGPRQYAAVKFLLYSLLGGLLMLVAVIALYVYSGESAATGHHGTFLFSTLIHVTLSSTVQKWLFLGFFIAFAIKAPLWPFHTWLPDASFSAQPGAAVLMLGVMDKVGTFGMIRYCLELFPSAAHYFTPLILTLAVISVLYGAIVAIGQTSMKRLIGYTSVSHFGFIVLGIFAFTTQGQAGATLYMVNHGFATGALFLVGRVPDRPARLRQDRRLRRRAEGRAGPRRAVPAVRSRRALAARAEHLRQRVPGAGRHLHAVQGGRDVRHRGHHPGRDLHPVDVPAHDDRPGGRVGLRHA